MAGTAVLCLGLLFFYKYFNFAVKSAAGILSLFSLQLNPVTLNLLLPVGISFYTFQTMSYVIDVYKGDILPEHYFGKYAAFISFFPQLVAGPIERTSHLLPQIKARHVFDYDQASYGIKLMAWGYFKKLVVADTLAEYVSIVYDSPKEYHGFALVLATFFFTIQIYCDFSGYSDIAIGTAKLLGIDLTANFKSPYFSQSIKEFWSRWHISLSMWFRDYVYIPLGGNRVSKIHHAFNLMLTFLASGLWHGADWTFVAWGGVHGAAQVIENAVLTKKDQKSTGMICFFKSAAVFIFCSFAWIFFVSDSMDDAFYVIRHLSDNITSPAEYLQNGFYDIGLGKGRAAIEFVMLSLLAVYDFLSLKIDVISELNKKNTLLRWSIYICFGLVIVFFSQKGVAAEFVYFQF